MPMKNGDIVPVTISGVTKGQKGAAGELRGYFSSNQAIGNLFMNSDEGVYGQLEASPVGTTSTAGCYETRGERRAGTNFNDGSRWRTSILQCHH